MVVIVGATVWTLSRKAAKPIDNILAASDKATTAAETLTASHIASEAVGVTNGSNCCLGHRHPAALLPENKGWLKHPAEFKKDRWVSGLS